jgi:CRISPR-associated endonuclease/helicase Cas3
MGSFLETTLAWLGKYRVPVILLSATISPGFKRKMFAAYAGKKTLEEETAWFSCPDYPCITAYSDHIDLYKPELSGRCSEVSIHINEHDSLETSLTEEMREGGVAGIILNTISRAQSLAKKLRENHPEWTVCLLHSRFVQSDRARIESMIVEKVNNWDRTQPKSPLIVIGTQVIEQSLDLDFDILYTDICPIDLLFQRIGRLHRHNRQRSKRLDKPKCIVMKSQDTLESAESVYERYQLMNTDYLLSTKEVLSIPADIKPMVHAAYSEDGLGPLKSDPNYISAKRRMEIIRQNKEQKAIPSEIPKPKNCKKISSWQSNKDVCFSEFTVRDIDPSIDVIIVVETEESFHLLPWAGGDLIPGDSVPDEELAKRMSGCKVRMPHLSGMKLDDLHDLLIAMNSSHIPKKWSSSGWLRNELYIILDANNRSVYLPLTIIYSQENGMEVINGE